MLQRQPHPRQEGQCYLVRSYVDAQNSFGAAIRTDFSCEVEERGGRGVLLDLQVE